MMKMRNLQSLLTTKGNQSRYQPLWTWRMEVCGGNNEILTNDRSDFFISFFSEIIKGKG